MRALAALIWKDLVIEARTRELLTSMSLVAFLALVIMSLAFAPSPAFAATAAPGVLWVTVAFAATFGLARSHALERERGALDALLLTPVGRGTLFLGKFGANLLLVVVLEIVVVAAFAVLFSMPLGRHAGWLVLPLGLGAVGFTAIGTLLGAMTAATRLREVLLPVLLLPVVLPVIVFSLTGIGAVLDGRPLADLFRSAKLLGAVDVVFLVLGIWLFEYVVEE
ncbi:MAG TPA: heme exporter protein CcmB [bacterium]|nr:heme exporter protein CcmB [bacterium]